MKTLASNCTALERRVVSDEIFVSRCPLGVGLRFKSLVRTQTHGKRRCISFTGSLLLHLIHKYVYATLHEKVTPCRSEIISIYEGQRRL